jgi:ParB family chromosome partitioning protein
MISNRRRAPKYNPLADDSEIQDATQKPNQAWNKAAETVRDIAANVVIEPTALIEQATRQVVAAIGRRYALVPVNAIHPNPFQPRQAPDDPAKLQSLAESIKADGLLEPILLVDVEAGAYQLIAGERRWRASMMAGLEEIPAEILDECSDSKMRRIALIENLLREQLTPMELALAYQAMYEECDEQGNQVYTIRSLAEALHQSRDHIDSHLALLRVPEDVQQLIVDDPTIPLRIIREIGGVEDPADRALLIEEVRNRSLKQADIVAILQANKKKTREKKEQPEEVQASPIARAIFLRKLQNEQAQFGKSLARIFTPWRKLERDERAEVHNKLRERIRILEEMLEKHPVDLS